jgi:hypothetical protein
VGDVLNPTNSGPRWFAWRGWLLFGHDCMGLE